MNLNFSDKHTAQNGIGVMGSSCDKVKSTRGHDKYETGKMFQD